MKTILIVNGGIEAVPGIKRAKRMGLYVVVSDANPHAPGFRYADEKIIASTYDAEETVIATTKFCKKKRNLDGVICIASDASLAVAKVASKLGLPGISIESAKISSDKLKMKKKFMKLGIPVPWFSVVENFEHLKNIVNSHKEHLIIKPVDSRGSRGVLYLKEGVDLLWAFNHSLSHSPTKKVMVETFLKGHQVSTESIIFDDQDITPGFVDRNYEYLEKFAPYIIENGGHQPSILKKNDIEKISNLAVEAGRKLGVQRGTIKGDMILTDKGAFVIEIATRLSGGWLATDQIPLATGIDIIKVAIKIALGEKIDLSLLKPRYKKGVAIRYFFPKPGKIISIQSKRLPKKDKRIHKINFFAKENDTLEKITNHSKRAGFVITVDKTREDAINLAEKIVNSVNIKTEII